MILFSFETFQIVKGKKKKKDNQTNKQNFKPLFYSYELTRWLTKKKSLLKNYMSKSVKTKFFEVSQ